MGIYSKVKVNIYIVLSLFIFSNCVGNTNTNIDTLRIKANLLVNKLDSICKDSVLDLTSNSVRFNTFVDLLNVVSQEELVSLIKKHDNNVVKGYAFVGLVILENTQVDALFPKYYKQLSIKVEDVVRICNSSETFMASIHKKKYRLQACIKNKKARILSDEEKKAIIIENKIRKEQGLPELIVPK